MAASYSNLLSLLRNGGPKFRSLSPETLLNAISYFLTHNHPKQVTSFTHLIAISPPLWSTLERLGDVGGAFRASVHMKVKEISKEGGEGWFARRTERAALGEWVSSILEGLVQATSASEGVVRLAIVGGVLQGLNDIKEEIEVDGVRGKVEDQVLVCVAELMDSMLGDDAQIKWENEFKVDSRDGKVPSENPRTTTLSLLPAALTLIPDSKLQILNLPNLIKHSVVALKSTFSNLPFLDSLPQDISQDADGLFYISPSSPSSLSLSSILSHPLFPSLGPLCTLISRSLSILSSDRRKVWDSIIDIQRVIGEMTEDVGLRWGKVILSEVEDENKISPTTRPLTTKIHLLFKSLLFTTVFLSSALLSSLITLPLPHPPLSPSTVASSVLHSFSNLSFIIVKFGGGFTEYKKAFYMSLDVVASSEDGSVGMFVMRMADLLSTSPLSPTHPITLAQTTFFLQCAEQLIPSLSDSIIEENVLPIAYAHLNDPSHRETYESAHSAMLTIFAKDEIKQGPSTSLPRSRDKEGRTLAERLIPFYLSTLLENAKEDKLSPSQFRLAFSNLVRSASSHSDALALLCIDSLWDALSHSLSSSSTTTTKYTQTLRLTLPSLLPSTSAPLLPHLLSLIRSVMLSQTLAKEEERKEMGKSIWDEMMRRVGDGEKEIVLRWYVRLMREFKDGAGVGEGETDEREPV